MTKEMKIMNNILNDEDKKYLSDYISRFKDRVLYIEKTRFHYYEDTEADYVKIALETFGGIEKSMYPIETVALPSFPVNEQFEGMEVGKKYAVWELGL